MTKVKRKQNGGSNRTMDKIKEITRALGRFPDDTLREKFWREMLTKKEISAISSRWELVKRLLRGDSQRKIARELHLSLCKITRGARELKRHSLAHVPCVYHKSHIVPYCWCRKMSSLRCKPACIVAATT